MNATATITLSNAIIEAQSVTDIAKRLANAPTENGADGCEAGELSRNQLLGQHAYHYCMDSDSPISADDFAKFQGDFSDYLTTKLSDFVRIAVEDLENEAEYAAQYDEYPLSRADIAQLSESVALEHAVKLAIQQAEPADARGILCVMADVSETGVIKISGAAEAESWSDVREAADKIEFVQHLQCGWVNYAGHYQVWAHGNPEPLNYLVAEAA